MSNQPTPITAYDFYTRKKVGDYESMGRAAVSLYIRSAGSISNYLYGAKGSKFNSNKRGVKSYKGGVYHFEETK